MNNDTGKHTCGECEFYGKKDLCPWPKDTPWPRRADDKQCRAYWLLVKTRLERDEALAEIKRLRKRFRDSEAEEFEAALAGAKRLTRERDEALAGEWWDGGECELYDGTGRTEGGEG